MKYCSHCGNQLVDEAYVCPNCGCRVQRDPAAAEMVSEGFVIAIKIFMILGIVASACLLIPLCWTIPMTKYAFRKLNNHEPIDIGFKVCTLIFVNLIAGILLLIYDTINQN